TFREEEQMPSFWKRMFSPPGDTHSAAPADGALVVLTQNAWGGAPLWRSRVQRMAERVRSLYPDVVGLQEIHAGSPGDAEGQARDLAERLEGYKVHFAPARVEASGACEGVALLSRHPVRRVAVRALSLDRSDLLDRAGQRVVLGATVEVPNGPL